MDHLQPLTKLFARMLMQRMYRPCELPHLTNLLGRTDAVPAINSRNAALPQRPQPGPSTNTLSQDAPTTEALFTTKGFTRPAAPSPEVAPAAPAFLPDGSQQEIKGGEARVLFVKSALPARVDHQVVRQKEPQQPAAAPAQGATIDNHTGVPANAGRLREAAPTKIEEVLGTAGAQREIQTQPTQAAREVAKDNGRLRQQAGTIRTDVSESRGDQQEQRIRAGGTEDQVQVREVPQEREPEKVANPATAATTATENGLPEVEKLGKPLSANAQRGKESTEASTSVEAPHREVQFGRIYEHLESGQTVRVDGGTRKLTVKIDEENLGLERVTLENLKKGWEKEKEWFTQWHTKVEEDSNPFEAYKYYQIQRKVFKVLGPPLSNDESTARNRIFVESEGEVNLSEMKGKAMCTEYALLSAFIAQKIGEPVQLIIGAKINESISNKWREPHAYVWDERSGRIFDSVKAQSDKDFPVLMRPTIPATLATLEAGYDIQAKRVGSDYTRVYGLEANGFGVRMAPPPASEQITTQRGQGEADQQRIVERETIPTYHAVKKMPDGVNSDVYKVILDEKVSALKTSRSSLNTEYEIVSGLQHPHILPVLEAGKAKLETSSIPFDWNDGAEVNAMRFRFIPNSLSSNLNQLTDEDLSRILHQQFEAIQYLHTRGIAHGDIKAEHILFEKDESFLIDFGYATKVDQIEEIEAVALKQMDFKHFMYMLRKIGHARGLQIFSDITDTDRENVSQASLEQLLTQFESQSTTKLGLEEAAYKVEAREEITTVKPAERVGQRHTAVDGETEGEQSFDKLFARDVASEQWSPELVREIPQYTLESLLETLPDAVASGKMVVDRLGGGTDGIVFLLSDQKDHAINSITAVCLILYWSRFTM